jgi:hypothetical protein
MKGILLIWCLLFWGIAQAAPPPPSLASVRNLDGIGTFGGDWPFPLGPEANLPENLSGLYEVREAVDGAYFSISREINPDTLRLETRMDLFDPCTFKPTATGPAFVRRNTMYGTLMYPNSERRVKLRMKSFQKSEEDASEELVLMIMKNNSKDMEKYFPVSKIDIEDMVKKCKDPKPRKGRRKP